jgi:hypothetical protein
MSNPWRPRNNNIRNHGNKKIGYVPVGTVNANNNVIKFYTQVVFKNGKWVADTNAKFGNYVKPRNGRNFIKVANLYGGYVPIKTTHRWSEVNKERRKPNKRPPYDPGLGYNQKNLNAGKGYYSNGSLNNNGV